MSREASRNKCLLCFVNAIFIGYGKFMLRYIFIIANNVINARIYIKPYNIS